MLTSNVITDIIFTHNDLYQCYVTINIIYQSKFPFSCLSLVESVSRESDEIRLSPSHQRKRETTRVPSREDAIFGQN